ncbi:hypothetical protein ACH4Q7_14885 [Streptomyces roseolus]|uniref:hypothetical protein n=1 Tax=Streptomyces roseolus TaxID=67358 RepID=UPI00378D76AC
MALAVPRTWVVGEVVTAAYMNAEIRDQWNDMLAAWTSYTPSWTASTTNPVLGNGTLVGRHKRIGRTVHVHIDLAIGSTTTLGSGSWSFTLPVQAAASGGNRVGVAQAVGATRFGGQNVISPGASATTPFFPASSAVSNLSAATATVPFAWAAANELRISFTYEAAS